MLSIDLDKNALRQEMLARRRQMPEAERHAASAAIVARFLDSAPLPPLGATLSGYWPINGEVEVLDLMRDLHARGYVVTLPVPIDQEQRLAFVRWTPETKIRLSLYGIPEPDEDARKESVPQFLIMPLLAFDAAGNRLGYGSGHFDRSFAQMLGAGHRFTTVAVAYDFQRVDKVPTGKFDYPMDMVITESAVYDLRGEARPA